MKKIILSLTGMVVALTIVFSSCQKEGIVNTENTSKPINENNIYTQKAKIVVGIKIVWDEWGRANYNCRKAGLCNIRIETVEIEVGFGKSAPIFTDEDGNMFAEVLVDNDIEFEGTSTNFYIDNDMITEYEDELYRIQAGVFEIDNSMGTMGGYKIPILKL